MTRKGIPLKLSRLSKLIVMAMSLAVFCLAAPLAQAKSAKLDGQLIAAATTKGSKVEAPILLTEKSAKKLKLRSPIATLLTKASKSVPAPNPTGSGTVQIAPGTLRAGDELAGKAKLKGKRKALMPKLKGKKLQVTARESRFSVEELTNALVALYEQVGALGLRVGALETGLADLRAEVEALKAKDASLQGQLDSLLAQITSLETALDALTSVVGGLPTAAELQAVIDSIAALQGELDALEAAVDLLPTDADITDLQNQIDTIDGQLTTLQSDVNGLLADVAVLCTLPVTCPA